MLRLFTCHGHIMPRLAELLFCIHVYDTNMAFKHISFLWSEKGMIVGHMGDTALLLGQKTHSPHLEHSSDMPLIPHMI